MGFSITDHTFAVCAYGDSPYLEECIESLLQQVCSSNILIATSTPSEYISDIAKKYNVPLFVNELSCGIASDWNFAVEKAETSIVTIAHQDDVYSPYYLEIVLEALNKLEKPLIAFTDYGELRDGTFVRDDEILRVKRKLLLPLTSRFLASTRFGKRFPISLGNPICCPAVTYIKDNLPNPLFVDQGFRSNLDWGAWERFSRERGSFVYVPKIGMFHRIHEESETSSCITDNVRVDEDLEMLKKFWPASIAKIINHFYLKAQKSNQV